MILLRRQRRDNRIGGLEDVVVARKSGFPCSDSGQGFVQIINIRQNHWLTLSNVLCASSHTCVYDSLHTLSVKPNKKQVSYPINVDQAACQISRREKSFTMMVENVQQQNLGEDCGLFAIVFAALLCNNQDPAKAVINQNIMRQELLHGLQDMDITRFVNKVTKIDESKEPTILYQWTCKVYCICHMPDDGSKMVQCSKCKTWYHQECVRGECTRNDWLCRNCQYSKRQEDAERRRFAAARQGVNLEGYRNIARKYPKQSKQTQELYSAIAATHTSYQFLEAASHIGCMNKDDWLEVQKLQHCSDYMGMTFPSGTGDDYDYYIAIFPDAFQSDKHLLCTIIHEMAHAMDAATTWPSLQKGSQITHAQLRKSALCSAHPLQYHKAGQNFYSDKRYTPSGVGKRNL